MGFDMVDRQFRRKEIKLECVDCGSTKPDVEARMLDDEQPLCRICYFKRHAWAV